MFLGHRSDFVLGAFTKVKVNDTTHFVRVFENYYEVYETKCSHKGVELTKDDFCDKRGLLQCPYHGLVQRPKRFDLSESDFYLMTNGSLSFGMELIHINEMIVKCHYTHWLINTMDINHVETVHKNTLAKSLTREVQIINEHKHEIRIKDNVLNSLKKIIPQPGSFFVHQLLQDSLSLTSFANIFYSDEHCTQNGSECMVQTRYYVAKYIKVPKL